MNRRIDFIEELCKSPAISGNALKIALILMGKMLTQKEICDRYNYKKAAVSLSIQKLWELGIIEKKQIHNSDVYYSNLFWKHNGLKLLQWNINGRSKKDYVVPEFVSSDIINRNADIIIINEFSNVYSTFQNKLENAGYYVIFNQERNDDNKVLIALKNKLCVDLSKDDVVEVIANNSKKEEPNFLQVTAKYNKKSLFIIGTRIRSGKKLFKEEQYEVLKGYLESLNGIVICAGDFNAWSSHISKNLGLPQNYTIYTPYYTGGYENPDTWSYIGKSEESDETYKSLIDHIIVKDTLVINPEYSWDFMKNSEKYNYLTTESYKSGTDMRGYPDHAILTATIQF